MINKDILLYKVSKGLLDLNEEELVVHLLEELNRRQKIIDYFQSEIDEYREHFISMRTFYCNNPQYIGSGTLEDFMKNNLKWHINSFSELHNYINELITNKITQ